MHLFLNRQCDRTLGEAFYALGSSSLASEHFEECLGLLHRSIVAKKLMAVPKSVVVRAMLGAVNGRRAVRCRTRLKVLSPEDHDAALCFERLAHVKQSNSWMSMLLSLRQLGVLENAGPCAALLRCLANVCYTASILRMPAEAEKYCRLAIGVANDRGWDGEATALAYANRVVGLYCMGIGSWDRAFTMLATAAQFSSNVHDWQGWYESVGYLALANMLVGHYETALGQIKTVVESVQQAGHNDSLAWVLCIYLSCILVRGPVVGEDLRMLVLLEHCLDHEDVAPLPMLLTSAGKGLCALAKLRRGEYRDAQRLARVHLASVESTGDEINVNEEQEMMGSGRR